jgi:hypothetical protein
VLTIKSNLSETGQKIVTEFVKYFAKYIKLNHTFKLVEIDIGIVHIGEDTDNNTMASCRRLVYTSQEKLLYTPHDQIKLDQFKQFQRESRDFRIEMIIENLMKDNITFTYFLYCIAHEMGHVKQYVDGDLIFFANRDDNTVRKYWKKELVTNPGKTEEEYYSLPWEAALYNCESEFIEVVFNFIRENYPGMSTTKLHHTFFV